jgi:DNA polymerase I-like protein with 3'-5' exonuclease and polymerase domains
MAAIPRDDFITYSCGDADATLRLAQRLKPILNRDDRQRKCYRRIQIPAILEFANTVELNGIKVNKQKLRDLSKELKDYKEDLYKKLIKYAPAKVKKEHLDNEKELKFSRADFVRDIYFTDKGFNLRPTLFTETTQDLPDDQKVAATSIKHLMWFTTEQQIIKDDYTVGDYTLDLINMQKATKMESTYSGDEKEGTGFWQYLDKDSKIHPSYMLHRTNTARSASADPNGQNIPVRGMWAPKFDDIFECAPGFKRVSCDLSQIELRLVAWMAQEPTMLKIYQEGGDIHCKTASSVLGISLDEFMGLKETDREKFDKNRFNAKATNFGFLYGLGARGFRIYAKTDYGIDYTEDECSSIRNNYFKTYYGLPVWHELMKNFAKKHGYVRSLLGRVRHLPGVDSDDEAIVQANLRFAVNSPIQGMASELGTIAMTRFCRNAPKDIIKVNAFIHDDIRAEVREDYVEEAASALKWVVENPPFLSWFDLECPIPILGEIKVDKEEREDILSQKPDWWRE